ncbi:MAG: hypothetical protein LM568_00160 [Desulfurococcaceae archaeon]|nr:hypothetical protein [Desulfurococcaceae archaeon]
MASSRDYKIEKIKMFMNTLLEIGFIIKNRKTRHFELYCNWAGGAIIRIVRGRRVLVVCVNPALLNNKEAVHQRVLSYALATGIL